MMNHYDDGDNERDVDNGENGHEDEYEDVDGDIETMRMVMVTMSMIMMVDGR